jgi:hypothetical protein
VVAARGVGLKRHAGNLRSEEGSFSYTTQPAAPVSGPCNNTSSAKDRNYPRLKTVSGSRPASSSPE